MRQCTHLLCRLRLVLPAMPAYFHCITGTARSYTFTIGAVLVTQTLSLCLGGAVINRAWLLAVFSAEPSGFNFVCAVILRAYLERKSGGYGAF